MPVQTFNGSVISRDDANWAVAQRIVGAFAPHAPVASGMTVIIDPGHTLQGTTLTEVAQQSVGPFTPPASGFRIDRIVVDRSSGVASIVAGTANSLTPPAIPSGKLPCARIFLESNAAEVTNAMIFDERVLGDVTPQDAGAVACRATRNGSTQSISASTTTKVLFTTTNFNVGSAFDTATSKFLPTTAGQYLVTAQTSLPIAAGKLGSTSIYLNGALQSQNQVYSNGSGQWISAVTDIVNLNGSSDYVEIYCWHNDATAINLSGNTFGTYVSATRVA